MPCERDGERVFIPAEDIVFVRADGHYTQVYTDTGRCFCVWPITEAVQRLGSAGFLQVHRSYLINPKKVARFERNKDKGKCSFVAEGVRAVPVSRSKMKKIEAHLAPLLDASGAA